MQANYGSEELVVLSSDYVRIPIASSNPKGSTEDAARAYSLVQVITFILEKIIGNEYPQPYGPAIKTKFHTSRVPGISLMDYLSRIRKYAGCSSECFVIALIYIDRLLHSQSSHGKILSCYSVHRIALTSIVLAAKFFDDQYYNNAFYAKVGGIPCKEMNVLEASFLGFISFHLFVSDEEYMRYYNELTKHSNFIAVHSKCSPIFVRETGLYGPRPSPIEDYSFSPGYGSFALDISDEAFLKPVVTHYVTQGDRRSDALCYVTLFSYENYIRVEYIENSLSTSFLCNRYLVRPKSLAHRSPHISPVADARRSTSSSLSAFRSPFRTLEYFAGPHVYGSGIWSDYLSIDSLGSYKLKEYGSTAKLSHFPVTGEQGIQTPPECHGQLYDWQKPPSHWYRNHDNLPYSYSNRADDDVDPALVLDVNA